MIFVQAKTTVSPKWEGLRLCYSCAVLVMLATLVMTARSCFNHWRQTDARHQLKPFHLLPNNVNIDLKSEAAPSDSRRGFNLKVLHTGLQEYPSSCHFEGPTDFFFFFRIYHDREIKLFLYYIRRLAKETRL